MTRRRGTGMSSTDEVKSDYNLTSEWLTDADQKIIGCTLLFIAAIAVCFYIESILNPQLPEIKSMVVVDKSDTGYIVCSPKEMTCYTMTSSEEIIIGDNIYGVEDME